MNTLLNRSIIILLVFIPLTLSAQTEFIQLAEETTLLGNYKVAEQYYNRIIQDDTRNIEARIGRGYMRAWQKNFTGALDDFLFVLNIDGKNLEALLGAGYALSWSGNHNEAEDRFLKALYYYPEHTEIKKALAYNTLWAEKQQDAAEQFSALAESYPDNPEYLEGLSQAYIVDGKQNKARYILNKAVYQFPKKPVFRQLLQSVRAQAAFFEIHTWTGYTKFKDTDEFGFRGLELSFNPVQDIRLFAKYDNSLSLDNRSLINAEINTPMYSAGSALFWKERFLSKIEIGNRSLPGGVNQLMYQVEQVILIGQGFAFKFGGLYAPANSGNREWFTYGAFTVPILSNWTAEPHYYYSSANGIESNQQKILLSTTYTLSNLSTVNAGIFYGASNSDIPELNRNQFGVHMLGNFPLGSRHWWNVLLRYEDDQFQQFVTAAVGIKIRFER